jgi:hypothetical protein
MPNYVIQVPKTYSARVGGNGLQSINVTVTADSPNAAKMLLAQRGVPAVLMGKPIQQNEEAPNPGMGSLQDLNKFSDGPAYQTLTGVPGSTLNSGTAPTNINDIAFDPHRRTAYNTAQGVNHYTKQPVGELQYYADGSPKSTGQYTTLRRDASGRVLHGGTEISSGTNFAPNVSPAKNPTPQQIKDALPFQPNTVGDPFYNPQPASYKRMTPADFHRIRTGQTASAFDDGSDLSLNESSSAFSGEDLNTVLGNQTQDEFSSKGARANAAAAAAKAAAEAAAAKAAAAKSAEDALVASRSFSGKLAAIRSGEINLYDGGTFGSTPFEDPEFWDAAFENINFAEGLEGDTRAAMLDAMARQIAASAGDNSFEAKKAVKEFYKQAESQMNSRGLGDLNLSDGGTLNTFAFAQQKTEKVKEVAETTQEVADAELASNEFDLGTGGGAIGGEGEGFFPDSKTADLVGNMTTFQPDPQPAQPAQPQLPEGTTSRSGMVNIQDIIDTFEQVNRMPPTSQVPVIDEFTGLPKREADIQVAGTPASVGFPATDPYTTPGAIVYETVVNPLLARLLDDAEFNNGMVSEESIYAAQNETQVEIAELRKEEALGVAYRNGVSAEAIATIQQDGDYSIAIAQQAVDKYVATQQLTGTQSQAGASSAFGFLQQGGLDTDLAQIYTGQNAVGLAEAAARSEVGLAEAAARESQAGAANLAAQNNAFSFAANQAIFNPNQIGQIAANSAAGLAASGQTESSRLQSEAQTAIARIQSNVGLDQNNKEYQIAQIVDQTQRAVAAITGGSQQNIATTQAGGQIGSANIASEAEKAIANIQAISQQGVATTQAGAQLGAAQASAGAASPYGFLQQGGTSNQLEEIFAGQNAVGLAQANPYGQTAADRQLLQATQFNPYALTNAQGYGLGQAQAANNPYAAAQRGQSQTGIDQILRGGLSADQRLAEINAGQSGQNFANQLNFMSNPSAIGFASEQGLFGGGNNQILQDINNSPEGNVPGSLFGFNSPSPAGAGGNQTTNTGNFNANTLRNASDEQIGFLQGAASAGGQTPSEFNQQVESFTPQGY